LSASEAAIENSRKATLKDKEFIYLFFEDNDMVGASLVKDAEIDLFFVNVKYQGRGYGKKILEYTINKGLEQNSTVCLNALANNEKALKIYQNAGFKMVQAQDCRKILL
jgi:GNAT superfamily N-acetyltransferase